MKKLLREIGHYLTNGSEPGIIEMMIPVQEYHEKWCDLLRLIKRVFEVHWEVHSETLLGLMAKAACEMQAGN